MRDVVLARVSLSRVARHELHFMSWLDAHDRERAAQIAVTKRRVDFIAGRVAAQRALTKIGLRSSTEINVEEGERAGAPFVKGANVGISIAHGAGWACAATAPTRIGLDIERIEPRHPALLDEAFTAHELERWADAVGSAAHDPYVVTLAWCAKEAWLKLVGHGLRDSLTSVAITPHENCTVGDLPFGVLRWLRASASSTDIDVGLWRHTDVAVVVALPHTGSHSNSHR